MSVTDPQHCPLCLPPPRGPPQAAGVDLGVAPQWYFGDVCCCLIYLDCQLGVGLSNQAQSRGLGADSGGNRQVPQASFCEGAIALYLLVYLYKLVESW